MTSAEEQEAQPATKALFGITWCAVALGAVLYAANKFLSMEGRGR